MQFGVINLLFFFPAGPLKRWPRIEKFHIIVVVEARGRCGVFLFERKRGFAWILNAIIITVVRYFSVM